MLSRGTGDEQSCTSLSAILAGRLLINTVFTCYFAMYSKSKLNCQGPYICLPWQCLSIVKPICTHIDPQDIVRTLLPFYCKVPRIQLSRVALRRRPAITQGPNPSAGVWHFSGPQNGYLEGGGVRLSLVSSQQAGFCELPVSSKYAATHKPWCEVEPS